MVPKAVQAAADAADQMMERFANPAPAAQVDTQGDPNPPEGQPQPQVDIPQNQPAPQPPADVNWEHRFQTLQGKYNAELPRVRQEAQELRQTTQALLQEIQELKQRTAAVPEVLVTDADREAFGADMVDLMERAARQQTLAVQKQLDEIRQANAQLQQKVGQVDQEVGVSANDRYIDKLTTAVPDWQTVNVNPQFHAWLAEVDPIFGMTRQQGLEAAYAKLDAVATARIFQAYAGTKAPAAPTPQQELQRQVAPTRSRVAAAPQADPDANRVWSHGEIEAFFTNQRRGNYDDTEAQRIESEINRAVAEGRVR